MPPPDPIPQGISPAHALARWPADQPVVLLASGGGTPRSRWSILAHPSQSIITPALADLPQLRADLARLEPSFRGFGPGKGWLGPTAAADPNDSPPFTSGWIGWLSYGLGAALEPAVGSSRRSDWPLMVWHRCEGALIHDRATDRWHVVGDAPAIRLDPQRAANSRLGAPAIRPSLVAMTAERYQGIVSRGIEYIRAGDVYQVNLAHTLDAHLAVPPRIFSASLLDRTRPWFGAHIEHVGPDGRARSVCSASPESFIEIDPVRSGTPRRIVTRPMKGTLAGDQPAVDLERSPKDRAELDMIVDLMRNDLGRVCATGSIRVAQRRAIERHGSTEDTEHPLTTPGVWQGVATVEGTLRPRVSLVDLLSAVFPPGSVTGAPKIRAMQIIESLEDRPRGPYCGCAGFIGDDGRVALNVAIRTALVEQNDPGDPLVSYSVGAGVVADSNPVSEWQETLAKAGGFFSLSSRESDGAGGMVMSA